MQIRDQNVDPTSALARKVVRNRIGTATSQTDVPVLRFKPRHGFQALDVDVTATTVAGTVTVDVRLAAPTSLFSQSTMSKNAGTAEQFDLTAFRFMANGTYVIKAAATGRTFSAAHVVSANKYGVILVQVDSAGTVTTKVPAATQAYDTSAMAVAALPAADANKVPVAYVIIANNAGAWTANTDDLTNGSDLTTATFVSLPITAKSILTGTITPLALQRVSGTLTSTQADIRDRTGTKEIVAIYTSDGTGALTNGEISIGYRPFPQHGEQY